MDARKPMPARPTARATPDPAPAQDSRQAAGPHEMATHLTVISVLNFITAGLLVLGGLFVMFVFSVGAAGATEGERNGAPDWISEVVGAMGFMLLVIMIGLALVFLFAGIKTVQRRRSGKVLSLVAAVLHLFNFPFGTAIGIYSFVILMNAKTESYWVD